MLPQLKALLIDMDGVVWRGKTALPGAREVIPTLRRLGIRYAFVTNNSTLTPEANAAALAALGVPAVPEEIVTSSVAAAAYLRSIAHGPTTVCVVGESGLIQALERAGFRIADEGAQFVVIGLDRQLTYGRLVAAFRAIRSGARFVATNADLVLPVDDGLAPGTGAIVAAISAATGVEPIIVGKPQPTLLQVALERLGVNAKDAAMVGDQPATDVRAGKAAGTFTILVQSELAAPSDGASPDLVVRDLAHLLAILEDDARDPS